MQQQNNETKLNVHIKVDYNEEYRRFVVETLSFIHLEQTLRSLLYIDPAQPIKILFLDDEKDWVLLTSDAELAYAWELSVSLLRLSVKHLQPARVVVGVPVACPEAERTFAPHFPCMRGRGCRGGKGRADPATRIQFLDNKLARLTERHAVLSAKIPEMTEDKARAVSWRVSHLENKIENIKCKKEYFQAQAAEQPLKQGATEIVNETATAAPVEHVAWGGRGRGGCRRGGRGGCQRWMTEDAETNPLFEVLLAKKAELKAARQGENKEEIQAKWEALQEAKTNWRDAKRTLMAARRQAK